MSQPNRKRQHQQSPPPVKEEQQEQQEEGTQSNDAGINGNGSQCSSANFENSNTIGTAAGGNAGDDINELKLKMATLEAKNQILEGKFANQELNARIHAMSEQKILANLKQENRALWTRLNEVEEENKKMKDEFGKRLTALEAKHPQQIAKLKATNARNQQQQLPNDNMPDCMRMGMPESQGQGIIEQFGRNTTYPAAIEIRCPQSAACLSANLPDCVNMQESSHAHRNSYTLDGRFHALESRHRQRQQTTMAATAASIPPLKSVVVNRVPCHSRQQQQEEEVEPRRLWCNRNPAENSWNPITGKKATMRVTQDELAVHNNSPTKWGNIFAQKGFFVLNHLAGPIPILFYFEITTKSPLVSTEGRLHIGLSNCNINKGKLVGQIPNTYAMQDDKRGYCWLSGKIHFFEWPDGAVKPYGSWDVFGCGIVLSANTKQAIFFTINGVLMGKQIPIAYPGSNLYPSVSLNRNVTVEANFGHKPFKYNIDQCPGLAFQW